MALSKITNQQIDSSGLPTGSLLQIQTYTASNTTNITTTTYTDINSRSFTPKSATSSLLVWVTYRWQENTNDSNAKVRILHDGTTIYEINYYLAYTSDTNVIGTDTFHAYVASTGSTNARTITFQAALASSGGTLSINANDSSATASRMTIMEFAG